MQTTGRWYQATRRQRVPKGTQVCGTRNEAGEPPTGLVIGTFQKWCECEPDCALAVVCTGPELSGFQHPDNLWFQLPRCARAEAHQ